MPTLAEIAGLLNVALPAGADGRRAIVGVNTLAEAGPDELSFLSSEHYRPDLAGTRAAAVLVHRRLRVPAAGLTAPVLVVDDADLAVARVLGLFAPPVPRPPAGVDHAARIAKTAQLGAQVAVGPNVFVGQRARIGARTVLQANVYVGDDTTLGEDCQL